MKSKKKFIVIILIACALIAAMILPRLMEKPEEPDPVLPPTVEISNPAAETIELFTALTGTIEPNNMVSVIPKMAGEVTEVLVKAGDQVTEGQLLCKIDNKQIDGAKISLESAKVSLNDAQTNLNRMAPLYESGAISAQNYEQAKNAVKAAKLQHESAKLSYDTQLEYSSVTAPISGRIENLNVEVHGMATSQSYICMIAGEGERSVTFSVSERIVNQLHPGDPIRIEKGGMEYPGVIAEIGSMVDAATGLFKIKASISGGEALVTGSTVKLYVTSDLAENIMTIPVDAVSYDGGDAYAFTLVNGAVHKTPVTVGIYDADRIEIISGLTMEDQVIISWSSELYEGAPAVTAIQPAETETGVSQPAPTTAAVTAETPAAAQ